MLSTRGVKSDYDPDLLNAAVDEWVEIRHDECEPQPDERDDGPRDEELRIISVSDKSSGLHKSRRKNEGGRKRVTYVLAKDHLRPIHGQRPQRNLPHKCRHTPEERNLTRLLHVRDSLGCEVRLTIKVRGMRADLAVLIILNTLNGKQILPLEIFLREEEADDEGDGEGHEERRDVTVEAGEGLAERFDGSVAVKGVGGADPGRETGGEANDGGNYCSDAGLTFPDQGEDCREHAGAD